MSFDPLPSSARFAIVFLIGMQSLGCGSSSGPVPAATVVTESGAVQGIRTGAVDAYLGIPYAAAPVGELRWRPPRSPDPWRGVREVSSFGSDCAQPASSPPGTMAGDEDCLFLNVYRPHAGQEENSSRQLPVMVWIHGGGLTILSGAFDAPPALLKDRNVIVVSMNYRLGFLGFFAHPALDSETLLEANYGLMDQQFALRWVQRNIAAFGGDPNRVTIFGTSAGALSVYSHLASPTASGLFHRGIAQSGSYEGLVSYEKSIVPIAEAEAAGVAFGEELGCSTAACLRAVPAARIVEAEPGNSYPILDGTVLARTPGAAFASGEFNRVPVIAGTSHDDYRFVVAIDYDFGPGPLNPAEYPGAVARMLGLPPADPFVATVLDQYPLSHYGGSAPIALGAAGTDRVFACPALSGNLSLARWVPTYAYEFDDENAPSFFDRPVSFPLGAYHSSEVLYLLNTHLLNTEQLELSDAWIRYWTTFAANGDPNSPGAPDWPPFDAAARDVQAMRPPLPASGSGFAADHMCAFWLP